MSLSLLELLLLLAVVALLFGTGKLTRAMGDLAQGARRFRDEMNDVDPANPVGERPTPRALPAPVSNGDQPARP